MSLTVYGNTVKGTSSDGYTRSWRAYYVYNKTDLGDSVKITVTSCGIEAMHSGTMSFPAKAVQQALEFDMAVKTSYTNSSSFSLTSSGTKKTLISTNYSITVPKRGYAITVRVRAPISVSSGAWKGTSDATVNVGIPAYPKASCSRAYGKIQMNGVRGIFYSANFQNLVKGVEHTIALRVIPTIDPSIKKAHPNIVLENDYLKVTSTASSNSMYKSLNCSFKDSVTGKYYDMNEMFDYGFKMYAEIGCKYGSWGFTDTYTQKATAKVNASTTSVTITTEEKLPFVKGDGTAEIEVIAYNFVNDTWDTVATTVKAKKDGDNLTVSLNLDVKYIKDPLATTSEAWVKFKYRTTDSFEYDDHDGFFKTSRNTSYSNGLANVMFCGGSTVPVYSSRVWYSYFNDPLYFPDDNFVEVGSNDTQVMGLTKIGEYLGIVKQGKTTDTSIYIAYPTSFDENTAYAVKPSVNGVGAYGKYTFNVLGNETLFLSKEGVVAISFSETDTDKHVKNRSFYVDGKLMKEKPDALENAYSFVWNGFYLLAVDNAEDNGHVYLLDGNQRNSWGNEKTNLVYECYFWKNVPAKCFAEYRGELWFSDGKQLCRFKTKSDELPYNDNGEPIFAEWSTILDDDGNVNFTKNLQKKGCVVSVMPVGETSAEVYIKKDEAEPMLIKEVDTTASEIPSDIFVNKKIKKYKRLQFIIKNNVLNQPFGIDQIIKVFTLGNYSKK